MTFVAISGFMLGFLVGAALMYVTSAEDTDPVYDSIEIKGLQVDD